MWHEMSELPKIQDRGKEILVCRKSNYPNKVATFEVLFRHGKDWIRLTNGIVAVLSTYHYFCFTHELEDGIDKEMLEKSFSGSGQKDPGQ